MENGQWMIEVVTRDFATLTSLRRVCELRSSTLSLSAGGIPPGPVGGVGERANRISSITPACEYVRGFTLIIADVRGEEKY